MPTAAELLAPGPHAAGLATLDLVDSSRPTAANGTAPDSPSRRLPTLVWYPADPNLAGNADEHADARPDTAAGPYPLIAYSHGFSSFSRENDRLAALLATRGFVVAAPEFPLTHYGAPGGENAADVLNQPGDVRFVIDSVLARSAAAGDPFHRLIDPARIGLVGVSLGGLTSVLTAFHQTLGDPRVKSVVAAAVPGCYLPQGFFTRSLPLLLLHGTLDAVVPHEQHVLPLYAGARPPKYLAIMEKGTHTGFGGVAGDALDGLDNPDLLGCAAIKDNPTVQPEALASLSQSFGGKPHDEALATCPAICATGTLPPAMKASRQVELLTLGTVAHVEARLAGHEWGTRFLEQGLKATGEDVTLQFEP